jgi:hypothetical protein
MQLFKQRASFVLLINSKNFHKTKYLTVVSCHSAGYRPQTGKKKLPYSTKKAQSRIYFVLLTSVNKF